MSSQLPEDRAQRKQPNEQAAFPDAFADEDVCYLTTVGRRTGRPHRIEIWFGATDGVLYLISGNGPAADWFQNLQAEPAVTVELAGETRRGSARVVTDADERQLVGDIMGQKHAGWGGDPSIGLTFDAWCYDVPVAAIERWTSMSPTDGAG